MPPSVKTSNTNFKMAHSVNVSVDDIKAHFSSTWPTFMPMNPEFMRYKDELHWGRVGKGHDDGNEIELDPGLVRVVEAAPEVRFQPPSYDLFNFTIRLGL